MTVDGEQADVTAEITGSQGETEPYILLVGSVKSRDIVCQDCCNILKLSQYKNSFHEYSCASLYQLDSIIRCKGLGSHSLE